MLRLSTPPFTVALYSRERRNEGHRVVVQSESRGRENSLGDERRVRHRLESDEQIEILHWTINCGGWDILVATARRANDERESTGTRHIYIGYHYQGGAAQNILSNLV